MGTYSGLGSDRKMISCKFKILVFFPKKMTIYYAKKNKINILMFVCTMVLYEYPKSLRNDPMLKKIHTMRMCKVKYIRNYITTLFIYS
jgi:hypothetical protein